MGSSARHSNPVSELVGLFSYLLRFNQFANYKCLIKLIPTAAKAEERQEHDKKWTAEHNILSYRSLLQELGTVYSSLQH